MNGDLRVQVEERSVVLRHPEKVLWPEDGLTKADLVAYLVRVAPALLPHLRGRFLVVTQYPDGIHGKHFYRKDAPDHTPGWVRTLPYWAPDARRWIRFVVCEDEATLAWLGSQAVIELHPWLSPCGAPAVPDFAVVDLDPAEGAGFADAVEVAGVLRDLLAALGLRGYPKLSGATGLHVYIPLVPRYSYRQTADFVRRLGRVLQRLLPGRVTLERTVARRRGVYVDYLQNARGKTLVAPYSPRPLPGAPVSFPVAWDDLARVHPLDFTLRTVPALLERRGDPFAPVLADRQELEPALARLEGWTR